MEFSIDWVFGAITLASVVFFFQMLVDFNSQRAQIAPQLQHIKEIRSRHYEEIEKVNRLTEEVEKEVDTVNQVVAQLEAQISELDAKIEEIKNQ